MYGLIKTKLNYLKVFDTKCHVPKINRKKWDAKSKEGFFVRYDGCIKYYRIWFSETKKIETNRYVIFESEKSLQDGKMKRKKRKRITYVKFCEILNRFRDSLFLSFV